MGREEFVSERTRGVYECVYRIRHLLPFDRRHIVSLFVYHTGVFSVEGHVPLIRRSIFRQQPLNEGFIRLVVSDTQAYAEVAASLMCP